MKKLSFLVIAASLGLAAAPAFAAAPVVASTDQVPMCSSTTAQQQFESGVYQQELNRSNSSSTSVDMWNGCVRAITTDASGHTTMAFYDPDTLALIGGVAPGKVS